jgi:homoserine kinase
VAGVALANEAGKLNLQKSRMLDYCLMIERHPDNVAAALYGGFVGTYLNDLSEEDLKRKVMLSERFIIVLLQLNSFFPSFSLI